MDVTLGEYSHDDTSSAKEEEEDEGEDAERLAGISDEDDDGSANAAESDASAAAATPGEEEGSAASPTAEDVAKREALEAEGYRYVAPTDATDDAAATAEDSPKNRVVVDYASKAAGALILEKSPNMKGTSNLLNSDNDRYAIAPCDEERKYVVIGLSEDILVKQLVLANYERYSSHPKEFQVLGSQTYPDAQWMDLGTYMAQPGNEAQTFDLIDPSWARYLKLRFVTHYGSEHYCTVSQVKVHGSTMLQGFHEQWKESEEEVKKVIEAVEEESVGDGGGGGVNAVGGGTVEEGEEDVTGSEGLEAVVGTEDDSEAAANSEETTVSETDDVAASEVSTETDSRPDSKGEEKKVVAATNDEVESDENVVSDSDENVKDDITVEEEADVKDEAASDVHANDSDTENAANFTAEPNVIAGDVDAAADFGTSDREQSAPLQHEDAEVVPMIMDSDKSGTESADGPSGVTTERDEEVKQQKLVEQMADSSAKSDTASDEPEVIVGSGDVSPRIGAVDLDEACIPYDYGPHLAMCADINISDLSPDSFIAAMSNVNQSALPFTSIARESTESIHFIGHHCISNW